MELSDVGPWSFLQPETRHKKERLAVYGGAKVRLQLELKPLVPRATLFSPGGPGRHCDDEVDWVDKTPGKEMNSRIIPGFTCQGGDHTCHDGIGSKSDCQERFEDGNFTPKHQVLVFCPQQMPDQAQMASAFPFAPLPVDCYYDTHDDCYSDKAIESPGVAGGCCSLLETQLRAVEIQDSETSMVP
ncbi:hypothetical protein A6R68_14094 [Neotoma lepida]|uniref:Uncharacterized protein n=1 Tax=Neotoma lepida TaxID=56216 RepID=A0A1A6HCM8_NEOLE|nr:hypothetical protein A6R68_14094 [Neotoma lepida]